MIKTKYSSIVSHKYNNQYICYDSSIQPILQDRILSCFTTDEFRLNNTSNFLDLNNGLIKKHFLRKGAMSIFNDYYLYLGLSSSRPIGELMNYIDFTHILNNLNNDRIMKTFEFCSPVFSYVQRRGIFYTGDIILSKIEGITLDKYISTNNIKSELTFIGIKSSVVENFEKTATALFFTVKFVSEIISVKRDKDNNVIEGDPNKIKTVIDHWKFTRKISSSSPNWYLAEIKSS